MFKTWEQLLCGTCLLSYVYDWFDIFLFSVGAFIFIFGIMYGGLWASKGE